MELGMKQESAFYWWSDEKTGVSQLRDFASEEVARVFSICSAFTVQELGELIPAGWTLPERCCDGWRRKTTYTRTIPVVEVFAETEADARAKMLVYLLENDLIPRDQV
jgi:hypothetical protein